MKILPFRMRWSTVHVSHFATMAPVFGLAIGHWYVAASEGHMGRKRAADRHAPR